MLFACFALIRSWVATLSSVLDPGLIWNHCRLCQQAALFICWYFVIYFWLKLNDLMTTMTTMTTVTSMTTMTTMTTISTMTTETETKTETETLRVIQWVSDLVTQLTITDKLRNLIMTLRVSDLQSESDLDIICNSRMFSRRIRKDKNSNGNDLWSFED